MDLSDLYERWQWAENNPEKAFEITKAGVAVCEETATKESIGEFYKTIVDHLPPASEALAKEADMILDGSIGTKSKLTSRPEDSTSDYKPEWAFGSG